MSSPHGHNRVTSGSSFLSSGSGRSDSSSVISRSWIQSSIETIGDLFEIMGAMESFFTSLTSPIDDSTQDTTHSLVGKYLSLLTVNGELDKSAMEAVYQQIGQKRLATLLPSGNSSFGQHPANSNELSFADLTLFGLNPGDTVNDLVKAMKVPISKVGSAFDRDADPDVEEDAEVKKYIKQFHVRKKLIAQLNDLTVESEALRPGTALSERSV